MPVVEAHIVRGRRLVLVMLVVASVVTFVGLLAFGLHLLGELLG